MISFIVSLLPQNIDKERCHINECKSITVSGFVHHTCCGLDFLRP